MLNNLKIGKRLALACGFALVLLGLVAAAGLTGLSRTVQTTYTILHVDARLESQAAQADEHTLGLRRFEKDFFLNMGKPEKELEYTTKWNKEKK
ncbi:MAG TPA: chemotaxis protein, partial [Thermoanaerobaculia bacterium]|nr:chemotaxis protein [Thermoanaerobaculia bacterium]